MCGGWDSRHGGFAARGTCGTGTCGLRGTPDWGAAGLRAADLQEQNGEPGSGRRNVNGTIPELRLAPAAARKANFSAHI